MDEDYKRAVRTAKREHIIANLDAVHQTFLGDHRIIARWVKEAADFLRYEVTD